jgi:hypothetical protein
MLKDGMLEGFSFQTDLPIGNVMDESMLDPESLLIPRWTIKRDARSACMFCRSIVVCVTTENRQMAFCSCRLFEYRLLPGPNVRQAGSGRS